MAAETSQPPTTKAILYGGHDSTIANILNALNVWQPQFPDYGITVLFELFKDKITNNYGVQVREKNDYCFVFANGCDFVVSGVPAKFNAKSPVFADNPWL